MGVKRVDFHEWDFQRYSSLGRVTEADGYDLEETWASRCLRNCT